MPVTPGVRLWRTLHREAVEILFPELQAGEGTRAHVTVAPEDKMNRMQASLPLYLWQNELDYFSYMKLSTSKHKHKTDVKRKHISARAITADGGLSQSLQGRAFI